ncbi:SDR family oxidoreductase [Reinekea blandensis]|uniref:NAD(P)-binding domain-containing protein n=1 Tax=Reinekea blandensis MED297 TaxID=314283 RepID=A4BAZ3_9GAMM|nr:SDR family oxidoreductase [Reinekea blandensis]EAR10606.1 hypothetical protein MED297_11340 [Reinekea sp. MED297] [Reinekea blandensis MED297]
MIAVTGATGQLGQKVMNQLLTTVPAEQLVALVRSPDKAADLAGRGVDVRKADYDQPDTLTSALAGVDRLLLISGSEIGQRTRQHQAVIDAAKAQGVELLVYTSILSADKSPLKLAEEHRQTEAALKASGVPHVILRNGWYTENYTMGLAGSLEQGAMAGAAGEGVFNAATRQDYAEAAVAVLTREDNTSGTVYELAGTEGFTLAQFAQLGSELSGKPLTYQNMPEADFAGLLAQVGLPAEFAAILADSEAGAADGWLASESKDLETLIGRPSTPLKTAIQDALN